ncbi:MAG: PEGA domain-containing protein [Deltaproteobacteria bacterium]|nr:PEGA domain-containing protein [Deltaproteobacteria bacterium]
MYRRHSLFASSARSALIALAIAGCTASVRAQQPTSMPQKNPPPGEAMPQKAPSTGEADTAAKTRNADPFWSLRLVIPKDQLPPLSTVRVRDSREQDKSEIRVIIRSIPTAAPVWHGGKKLGETPLTLTAPPNSTSLDIVIKQRGFMTLRTRIHRREKRTYTFKLHPAKLR